MVDDQLEDKHYFLSIGIVIECYTIVRRNHLLVKRIDYKLIFGQLYKLSIDEIWRSCLLKHKREDIIRYVHARAMEEHSIGKETMHNIVCTILWEPTIFRDSKEYCEAYDVCERYEKPSRRDEFRLNP